MNGFAHVIPRQGRTLTEAELIAWCRGEMANFKVPRHVEFVPALPLNPSGKVLKFELRARARGYFRPGIAWVLGCRCVRWAWSTGAGRAAAG
jgi:acyl-CoA synthetase (AMP-forming)/AMP-acid ligase II